MLRGLVAVVDGPYIGPLGLFAARLLELPRMDSSNSRAHRKSLISRSNVTIMLRDGERFPRKLMDTGPRSCTTTNQS